MPSIMPLSRIGELIHSVLFELKEMGSEAKPIDLFKNVESKINLSDKEKETTANSKTPRWITNMRFYSIDEQHNELF